MSKKAVAPAIEPSSDMQKKDDAMKPDGASTRQGSVLLRSDATGRTFRQTRPFAIYGYAARSQIRSSGSGNNNGIAVSAAIVQSLGIRTANPVQRDVQQTIRVPARVVADARGQARVQARVSGWVERLYVRAVGQQISPAR